MGGTQQFADDNKLSCEEALGLFTTVDAWFSQEETITGRIAPGQYGDLAVLNADYLTVPEERIKDVESLLTMVAGKVTYAAKPFDAFAPPVLPAVSPAWSRVAHSGEYQNRKSSQ
jgi:predicted amidohydrolase YtcJ